MRRGKKTQNRARWVTELRFLALVVGGISGNHVAVAQPCSVMSQPIAWHQTEGRKGPAPFPSDPENWNPPPQSKELHPGTYLLRVQAVNTSPHPVTCIFLPDKLVALAELFTAESLQPVARSGWLLPLDQRAAESPQAVLPAVLSPGTSTFWLRLWLPENAPKVPKSLALEAQSLENLAVAQRRHDHGHGIYGGIMLAVVLYNLFLFFRCGKSCICSTCSTPAPLALFGSYVQGWGWPSCGPAGHCGMLRPIIM